MNSVSAREGLLKQVLLKQVGLTRVNMLQHAVGVSPSDFLCQAGNSFLADPTFPQRASINSYLRAPSLLPLFVAISLALS